MDRPGPDRRHPRLVLPPAQGGETFAAPRGAGDPPRPRPACLGRPRLSSAAGDRRVLLRRAILGIVVLTMGAGCTGQPRGSRAASGADVIHIERSPSPFSEVTAGAVRAMIPDGWQPSHPGGAREGFFASPSPTRGRAWTARSRASRPRGSTRPWSASPPTSTTWRRRARSSRSWPTPANAAPIEPRPGRQRPDLPSGAVRLARRLHGRAEGTCTVEGMSTRWAYFVAAPGFGPVRQVGIPAPACTWSSPCCATAGRPTGRSAADRRTPVRRHADPRVRRCGPPAGHRRALEPRWRSRVRAQRGLRSTNGVLHDGRPRHGGRGCPPRPRRRRRRRRPATGSARPIPRCRMGENVPLVTSPISSSPPEDRIVRARDVPALLHQEPAQPARQPFVALPEQRLAPAELALVERDGPCQTGLEGGRRTRTDPVRRAGSPSPNAARRARPGRTASRRTAPPPPRSVGPQVVGDVLVREQLEAHLARVAGAREDHRAPAVLGLDASHERQVGGLREQLARHVHRLAVPGRRGSTSPGDTAGGAVLGRLLLEHPQHLGRCGVRHDEVALLPSR